MEIKRVGKLATKYIFPHPKKKEKENDIPPYALVAFAAMYLSIGLK